MTIKLSKTSISNSSIVSCNKNGHENIHSNNISTDFDVNDNLDTCENGDFSPTEIRKNPTSHHFVYSERFSRQNTETQIQIPSQDPTCLNETSEEYSQINSQSKNSIKRQTENHIKRGCVDLYLDIDFDIF